MDNKKGVVTTMLGGKMWALILLFGFIGQLAWSVENMYFSKFMMNDICSNSNNRLFFNWLLIGFSAIAATSATLIGGAMCDRVGKRKVFISYGYIVWGFTIMAFALIPLDFAPSAFGGIVTLVIVMDCIMSFIGATANDAAYNTWLTDYTDTTNRGKVDTVLSMLPVLATVFIVLLFDKYTSPTMAKDGELIVNPDYNWPLFFLLNGIVPIIVGIIGIFILKDKPGLKPVKNRELLEGGLLRLP
jgi:Major Facilitator Superfamily.